MTQPVSYRWPVKWITCVASTLLAITVATPVYCWIMSARTVMVAPLSRSELRRKLADCPKAALYRLSDNGQIVFEHRPDAVAQFKSRETREGWTGAWRVTTDHRGLRNNDPPVRSHSRKIVMLGDSITFGLGLNDSQTIPSRLSQALSAQMKEPVDCLNYGVSSYTTIQEVAYFEHQRALDDAPEMVVVGFCVNDFATGIGSLGVVEGQIQLLRPEMAAKLNLGTAKLRRQKPIDPRKWRMQAPTKEQVDASFLALDRLRKQIGNRRLMMVLFPRSYQLTSRMRGADHRQRLVRDYCDHRGITCIDLLGNFHGCDPLDFYRPGDGLHPNSRAAGQIAQILAPVIRRELSEQRKHELAAVR